MTRFCQTDGAYGAILDRSSGLVWRLASPAARVAWLDASQDAARDGARLPTASELLDFLSDPTDPPPSVALVPGMVFWSTSESPFAPASQVRAVACESDHRFAVVLVHRNDRALAWQVRAAGQSAGE